MVWPQNYRLIRHGEIDSTNSEARRLAEAGDVGLVWIAADRQTAGRGRRGRIWDSGSGNLAATLLVRPPPGFAQLSFAAALAVSDTALHFAPSVPISVKWPNDVLANGRKLAGILLESGQDAAGSWLAVGIGINLAGHPEGTEFPATSLADFVSAPSSQEVLTVLAARFAHWYAVWMEQGFETLRAAWLARAGGLNGLIRARLPYETLHGIFEGIDASGALLLNEQGTVRAITAGEVFF